MGVDAEAKKEYREEPVVEGSTYSTVLYSDALLEETKRRPFEEGTQHKSTERATLCCNVL